MTHNMSGKRALSGLIAVTMAIGGPVALASTANAETPDSGNNAIGIVESNQKIFLAEENPFNYANQVLSPNGEDFTNPGATISPELGNETPVAFAITSAEDENGVDITSKLRIDDKTGEITVTEDIGDLNTLFYLVEVKGTYADGSNHADKVFVINESFTNALPSFNVQLGNSLAISENVLDFYTKLGDDNSTYQVTDNTPEWVSVSNGLSVNTANIPGDSLNEGVNTYEFEIVRINNETGVETLIPISINVEAPENNEPTYVILDEKTTVAEQADLVNYTATSVPNPVFTTNENTPDWVTVNDDGVFSFNTVGTGINPGIHTVSLNVHNADNPDEAFPITLKVAVLPDGITPPVEPRDRDNPVNEAPTLSNHPLVTNTINAINNFFDNISDPVKLITEFTERRDAFYEEHGLTELFQQRESVKANSDYERFDQEKMQRFLTVLGMNDNDTDNPTVTTVTIDGNIIVQ